MQSQVVSMIMIMDMLCPLMEKVRKSLQRLATIFRICKRNLMSF